MSKIFYFISALGFFALSGYLLLVSKLELPSRMGSDQSTLTPPATYFASMLPLAFGISLLLLIINRDKYIKHCGVIVATGVAFFFLGLVVVPSVQKFIISQ